MQLRRSVWLLRHLKVDIDDAAFWQATSLIHDSIRLDADGHGHMLEMVASHKTGGPA